MPNPEYWGVPDGTYQCIGSNGGVYIPLSAYFAIPASPTGASLTYVIDLSDLHGFGGWPAGGTGGAVWIRLHSDDGGVDQYFPIPGGSPPGGYVQVPDGGAHNGPLYITQDLTHAAGGVVGSAYDNLVGHRWRWEWINGDNRESWEMTSTQIEIYPTALGPYSPGEPAPGDVSEVVDDSDVFIDTLTDVTNKVIRIERLGYGSGSFQIPRDSADAETIGTGLDGRMVKVTIPRIDPNPIFRWMIENIKVVVAGPAEKQDELLSVAGRGALAYLGRCVSSPYTYVFPAGPVEVHQGPAATGTKPGQILRRIIAESQHASRPQQPIPLIVPDFDYTNDSAGNPWSTVTATDEMNVGYTGESLLVGIEELWGSGEIDILLKPDGEMTLQGFNHYGRNLTSATFGAGKVRFVKGVNIADQLGRTVGYELPPTYAWVEGDNFVFVDPPAELPGGSSGRPVVETFIRTPGTNPTSLEAVGTAHLVEGLRRGESVAFNVAIVKSNDLLDENAGYYLPGPPGTNGHFWIGDEVTLHTGTGANDFDNETVRIEAITIWFDDANNLLCKVEVKATTLLGRLPPSTGSRSGTLGGGSTTPGSASSATGGSTQGGPPASSIVNDHLTDPTDAHDASAISVADANGDLAATDVEAALAEIMPRRIAHLTNKSGASVAAGDVVIVDTANDSAFTTTTTGRAEVTVGIAQATIANNAAGPVLLAGLATLVNVPASVTRGHYVETHTVAKQATGSSTRRSGSMGQFITGGTTPRALLWGQTDQTASGGAPDSADYLVGTANGSLTSEIVVGTTPGGELGGTWASPTVDATHSGSAHADFIAKSLLTTQDDIIVRDGTGPARLAKGTDGQVLTVDPTTHHLVWATPASGSGGDTTGQIGADFDGGGSALTGTHAQDIEAPYAGTITGWKVLAPQSGSVTIGVAKATYSAFDTFTDMIGGGTAPSLSSAKKNSAAPSGWSSTTFSAGDIIRISYASPTTIQQLVVVLEYNR